MADAGDGAPSVPETAVTREQMPTTPLPDASSTPEELEAKINAELGLPETPKATPSEPETPAEPETPPAEGTEPEPSEPAGEENAEEAEPAEEEPVEPTEPATPSDEELFIEIEDAEGVTHKITSLDDLPDDFAPKSNKQALEILDQLRDLRDQINARESTRAQAQLDADRTAAQKEQFTTWDKEIDDLGKQKRLDVKDTDRISKVFDKMVEINTARQKAGNTNFITSFEDALEKLEAAETKATAASQEKDDNDRAKAKASLLGGSSSTTGAKAQPYISGRYRDIMDIPV